MDLLVVLLRLVHILAGVFWTGSAVMLAFFLFPAVRAAGPAGGSVMQQLMNVRKLPIYLTSAGVLTLLSGLGMYWRNGALSNGAWFATMTARTLGVGAVFAIIAGILGGTTTRKTAMRIAALGAEIQRGGGPPSAAQGAEMAALQAKLSKALHSVAGLLLLAAAAMAVARYT
jgi:hypothetical protein